MARAAAENNPASRGWVPQEGRGRRGGGGTQAKARRRAHGYYESLVATRSVVLDADDRRMQIALALSVDVVNDDDEDDDEQRVQSSTSTSTSSAGGGILLPRRALCLDDKIHLRVHVLTMEEDEVEDTAASSRSSSTAGGTWGARPRRRGQRNSKGAPSDGHP